jgi:hypothetical protein
MAGNSNFDSLISTTLQNHASNLEDNVFNPLPLFNWLSKKGNVKTLGGGRTIVKPIIEAKNTTAGEYASYSLLDTTPQDEFTSAEYNIRQYSVSIAINGLEEFQNSSEWEIINLLEGKIKNAEMSLRDVLNTDAFASQSGNKIEGLQNLVNDAGTGTVGNINSSTNTYWQNQKQQSVGSFASNGVDKMRAGYNSALYGSSRPDVIFTTEAVFGYYEKTMASNERYLTVTGPDGTGKLSFPHLAFKATPVLFDRACPSGTMYLLNSNHLFFEMGKGKDFVTTPFVRPENQDAKVAQILVYGNLVVDSRRTHCVLSGITA